MKPDNTADTTRVPYDVGPGCAAHPVAVVCGGGTVGYDETDHNALGNMLMGSISRGLEGRTENCD